MAQKRDLVEFIKSKPEGKFIIDNDCWWFQPDDDVDGENNIYDDDFFAPGDGGYGSGNCYGGDILQALGVIVGIKLESV